MNEEENNSAGTMVKTEEMKEPTITVVTGKEDV